jgi:peptidyl-dipeptidase A
MIRLMSVQRCLTFAALLTTALAIGCSSTTPAPGSAGDENRDPKVFLKQANDNSLRLSNEANQAAWVQETYITQDTEALASRANEAYVSAVTDYAKRSSRLEGATSDATEKRQLMLLHNSQTMASPSDKKESTELSELVTAMDSMYGKGKYCPGGEGEDNCLDIEKITDILATSRDPRRIRDVWEGWHTISVPMKPKYQRFVELSNKGARELGFADTGAMWRSRYDMPPDAFSQELDRLWNQLRPLYLSLHTYVRARLHEKYGELVPLDGPIPADLLGNIWAQDWSNIYDLVAPPGSPKTYSLTDILKAKKKTPIDMVHYGEGFFTSLGFAPLPKTFWERSLFVKPRDRDVVCHASAWYVDNMDDLRIKMCIDQTAEDFSTIHHELGHLFYAREYNHRQPMLFRDSANDGFHEAIGDTMALSVTPEYLVKIGLLDKAPDASGDIPLLMRMALDKLAFLPFGLVVDQWRWQVFNGQVTPDHYNQAWWDLREKYQGIRPPSPRGEEFFDPGAKYHVPSNTPYARYFLADVLEFQFHRALAKVAGCTAPLNRCSIYGNAAVGERLRNAVGMGASRPWPDALEAITGSRQMDATAIADYFAPLKAWLDKQNQGRKTGW